MKIDGKKPPLDKKGGGGYNEYRKGAADRWASPLVTRSNRQLGRPLRLLLVVIYLYNQAQQINDNQAKCKQLSSRHWASPPFWRRNKINLLRDGGRPNHLPCGSAESKAFLRILYQFRHGLSTKKEGPPPLGGGPLFDASISQTCFRLTPRSGRCRSRYSSC